MQPMDVKIGSELRIVAEQCRECCTDMLYLVELSFCNFITVKDRLSVIFDTTRSILKAERFIE